MKLEITSVELGDWIKRKRLERHMKQYELARLIPVNPNTLSRYVTGEISPTLEIVERIAEIFNAEIVIREKGYDERREE